MIRLSTGFDTIKVINREYVINYKYIHGLYKMIIDFHDTFLIIFFSLYYQKRAW